MPPADEPWPALEAVPRDPAHRGHAPARPGRYRLRGGEEPVELPSTPPSSAAGYRSISATTPHFRITGGSLTQHRLKHARIGPGSAAEALDYDVNRVADLLPGFGLFRD